MLDVVLAPVHPDNVIVRLVLPYRALGKEGLLLRTRHGVGVFVFFVRLNVGNGLGSKRV